MPWRGRARDAVVPRHFDARVRTRKRETELEVDQSGHSKKRREEPSSCVASALPASQRESGLFEKLTFHFDGWFPEGADALRGLVERHGGSLALAYGKSAGVTHYVVEDYGTMEEAARERAWNRGDSSMRCVRGAWITDSIARGKLVENVEAYAPRGTPKTSPRGKGRIRKDPRATEMDLVDLIVDTAWNGTGGVSTQERLRETWTVRVIFEQAKRAMSDVRLRDAEVRKISTKAYNALKKVVDEKWIVPVSACEALVDISGTRNLQKRNRYETSQTSPADVAQALEWIMVDKQGVNVRASMHDMRNDGWDPSWLRERVSMDAGVVTRRASRAAEEAVVAAASQDDRSASGMKTLSQLSEIEPEIFEALDQQTRYEWSKARADAEKKRLNHRRAEQSAVFQLLKAGGTGKVSKANKARSPNVTPTKRANVQRQPGTSAFGGANGSHRPQRKTGAQMSITAYASPLKREQEPGLERSHAGEPIMTSATVHTATLLHALDRVLTVDAQGAVDGRLDVAADVVRLHIIELARDRRRQEVKGVRNGLENLHSDHPRWVEVRGRILASTAELVVD